MQMLVWTMTAVMKVSWRRGRNRDRLEGNIVLAVPGLD